MIPQETKDKISSLRVPIIIVSHNNHKYVENTIEQIQTLNRDLMSSIVIMDNNSDNIDTREYLDNNTHNVIIVRNTCNEGPWISTHKNAHLFAILPDRYIITDPDLEFHHDMPPNFVDILCDVLEKYPSKKVGLAISVADCTDFYPYPDYQQGRSIYEWESQFWHSSCKFAVTSDNYYKEIEAYSTDIDTTLALYNKTFMNTAGWWSYDGIRLADDFTCRHLPFYKEDHIMTVYDKYNHYASSKFSSIGHFVLRYINENYNIIRDEDDNILMCFLKK
jgi:hypothetical protein